MFTIETEVMGMGTFWNKCLELLSTYGGKIVLSIVVLLIGHFVIKSVMKLVDKALEKSGKLDATVRKVARNVFKFMLYMILVIAVVEILGVPVSSVIAILASCGLAIGMALQGALTNIAGGIMILIFKPFKVGDFIDASGATGTVTDISIIYTQILTIDNKKVFVPNGDLMGSNVTNFSAEATRRVDIDFKITNDIDAELVKKVLLEAAAATTDVLPDPAPFARMTAVDDDTYIFTVRAWCETAKYWPVYFDVIENCSKALAENGIEDPEERIAIRMVNDKD